MKATAQMGGLDRLTMDNLLNQCRLYVGDVRAAFTDEEQLALAKGFLALQALESVRSEALEEAAKVCENVGRYHEIAQTGENATWRNIAAAIRLLQLSPARVAEEKAVHDNELRK